MVMLGFLLWLYQMHALKYFHFLSFLPPSWSCSNSRYRSKESHCLKWKSDKGHVVAS